MWLEANESTQILLLFVTLKQAISAGWGGGGRGSTMWLEVLAW